MNPTDRAEFDRITQLTADAMTEHDKAVLRARRSYLGKTKTKEFADVLKAEPVSEEGAESEETEVTEE